MEASLGKTVVTVALASAVAWQVRLCCSFGGAADLAAENRRLRAALAKAGVTAEAGGGGPPHFWFRALVVACGAAAGAGLKRKYEKWLRELESFRKADDEARLRDVVVYRVEQWWATSPWGIPVTLLGASVGVVALSSVALKAAVSGVAWEEALFTSWLFIADPSAHAAMENAAATAVGLVVTCVGLVIFGFVVSVTTEVMASKLEGLKMGNSAVLEQNHTLVLGFSENLRPLIAQIALANESEGGGTVVVLSDSVSIGELNRFLQQSEDAGFVLQRPGGATECVARHGSPLKVGDLRRVSAATAKSVVVLADHDVGADESDAKVMRAVLALSAFDAISGHIVAEVRDVDNAENVRLVSRHPIECVVANDAIGRMMINCARQPALASVLQQLLGFEGDEFYLASWPELVGKTFRDVLRGDLLENAVPVGVRRAATAAIELNPKPDDPLEPGDEVIVIAEDDDTYGLRTAALEAEEIGDMDDEDSVRSPSPGVSSAAASSNSKSLVGSSAPQRYLFLGWRNDIADMVAYLDEVAPAGSSLTIASPLPVSERERQMTADGRHDRGPLVHVDLDHVVDTCVSRAALERLELSTYDAILILSDQDCGNPDHADSLALATLILTRDIQRRGRIPSRRPCLNVRLDDEVKDDGDPLEEQLSATSTLSYQPTPTRTSQLPRLDSLTRKPWAKRRKPGHLSTVVTELRDISLQRNVLSSGLADCDFVASHELVARIMAMVSERAEVGVILHTLLDANGPSLLIVPATKYVNDGDVATFHALASKALDKHGDVAIGTLRDGRDLVLNPRDKTATKITWTADDGVAVIAAPGAH